MTGIEYRTQESTDRIGIAPSLICRYTCGHPIGLKARAQFFANGAPPASTLIGVVALAMPEWLVEIEAVAVAD